MSSTGGCLCLAGDCPHCLATVDGVSYVRTCQTAARPGMVVQRHHTGRLPAAAAG
ncbi:MAG: 2Fe-2S iron-sulfur cluster-binding protein [Caldilineaceae bacterium]